MVKNENYVVIQGFMINDLKLKGNELIIYAIIYGFTQERQQVFNGSMSYLAAWTNSTRFGASKSLANLVAKGLVAKVENGAKGVVNQYIAMPTKLHDMSTKLLPPANLVAKTSQQSWHNNSSNNLVDNSTDNLERGARARGRQFTKPTLKEVEEYCLERNKGVDPQKWYDHYTANGWRVGRNPMRDWRAAVRTWERNGITTTAPKAKSNESPLDQMARVFGEAE